MILSTKTDGFFCHGEIQLPLKIGSNTNNRQLSCQLEGRPFKLPFSSREETKHILDGVLFNEVDEIEVLVQFSSISQLVQH